MKQFLDYLARIIIAWVALAVVGIISIIFYRHPEVILPVVIGFAGVVAFIWAMDRVCD